MTQDPVSGLLEDAVALQSLVVSHATGGAESDSDYRRLRQSIVHGGQFSDLVPKFIRTCRTLNQFWEYIKGKFAHYKDRRSHIYSEFQPLLDALEGKTPAPSDKAVLKALEKLNAQAVLEAWNKALDRRTADPEGAITSARTLLETVCKHILDDKGVTYGSAEDLPRLYNLTCQELKLAPSQHSEKIFKQILGNCTAVVEGLGALRNRLGDAHGHGRIPAKPAARHAGLAVNLAGSAAMFLVETWEARSGTAI